jgi:hypothetical protein
VLWLLAKPLLCCVSCCLQSVSQQLCELLLATPSSGPWKQQLQEQKNKVAGMQDRLEQREEQVTTVQDSLRDLSCSK